MEEYRTLDDSNYSEWSNEELKKVCDERLITTRNAEQKLALVERLRGYDIALDALADNHDKTLITKVASDFFFSFFFQKC